jgi:spermidine synthase
MSIFGKAETTFRAVDETAAESIAVGLLFFVSGIPALIYQLVWQRPLSTMYGVNVEAVTVVVAGFLLGLGFGSLAGGLISRLSSLNLLAAFGAIELIVCSLGITSLNIIEPVGQATLHWSFAALSAVALLLLFVPTLFMGSTLPILTAYLVGRSRSIGKSVGLLYCVNTVGSAVACFASAMFLMRIAGMRGSVTIAAAINCMVGIAALAEAWRTRGRDPRPRPQRFVLDNATREAARRVWPELIVATWLAGLLGYISLSYEIVWFRAFSIATNTSTAFALVLGVYLAGIANGALRVRRILDLSWAPGRAMFMLAAVVLAASMLGFALLPVAAYSATTGVGYFYPMLVMVFVQTSFSGMVFPMVCHYAIPPDAQAGARVSWVYVANILGSVAGTLVTGFVLMNCLSIGGIAALLGTLGAGIALLIALRGGLPNAPRPLILGEGSLAAVAMPVGSSVLFDGFYDRLLSSNTLSSNAKLVEIVENRNGVITADQHEYVYGSGAYDGRIAIDLMDDRNLLIRPFSLSLFHPRPERVLMIGLATGAWAQVIAYNPSVKHLTVVEINPGYLQIIKSTRSSPASCRTRRSRS